MNSQLNRRPFKSKFIIDKGKAKFKFYSKLKQHMQLGLEFTNGFMELSIETWCDNH